MINSNFVGCSTGRSAGLAPLRILSTYLAARRCKLLMLQGIGHKPTVFHKFWHVVDRRETVLCGESCNLRSLGNDDEARQRERCFSTTLLADLGMRSEYLSERVYLGIEAAPSTPLRRVPPLCAIVQCPVRSKSTRTATRESLGSTSFNSSSVLSAYLRGEARQSRDVAARPCKAGDNPEPTGS